MCTLGRIAEGGPSDPTFVCRVLTSALSLRKARMGEGLSKRFVQSRSRHGGWLFSQVWFYKRL